MRFVCFLELLGTVGLFIHLTDCSLCRAHKYRGFSDSHDDDKAELTDFFNFPVGVMAEYKEQVSVVKHEASIFDIDCSSLTTTIVAMILLA